MKLLRGARAIIRLPGRYLSFAQGEIPLPSSPAWGDARGRASSGIRYVAAKLRDEQTLVGIFLFALVLRVTYNLTVARNYNPVADAAQYIRLATNLLQYGCYCYTGPGYPTTVRPPVYPLFLAGVFAPLGVHPLLGRLALSVVGAGTCVVVSLLARDLFGRTAGITAGIIAATYPQLFIWDAWLYSESLAIFLYALSCLVVMRAWRRPSAVRWVLAGVLIGVTALTRPNGIYALIAVVLAVVLSVLTRDMGARRAAIIIGLLLVGAVVIMAPWTIRNYVVTDGAFVPISTGGGIVLAGSYNSDVYYGHFQGEWVNPLGIHLIDASDRAILNSFPLGFLCAGACEVARDQAYTQVAERWATSHPDLLPSLLLIRAERFWGPASGPGEAGMPVARPYAEAYPRLVMLLAAIGLVLLLRRRRDGQVFAFCLFGVAVIVGGLVFYGSPRMRAPLEPFMVVLAAGAATQLSAWLIAYIRRSSSREQAPVHIA